MKKKNILSIPHFFSLLTSLIFLILQAPGGSTAAELEEKDFRWSIASVTGMHQPSVDLLNEGLFQSPVGLEANLFELVEEGTEDIFALRNPLPPLGIGPVYGMEFKWYITKKQTLLFGGNTWEKTSKTAINTPFPFQGNVRDIIYERRATLSYNQIYLGWRYNFFSRSKRYKLYTSLSVHEFFDIDYEEHLVYRFFFDAEEGEFKRNEIAQFEASGLLMLQIGLSGEFFVLKWLSIGLKSGYYLGTTKPTLKFKDFKSDFTFRDNVTFTNQTFNVDAEQNILYRTQDNQDWRLLELDMSGWVALLKVNIYFK